MKFIKKNIKLIICIIVGMVLVSSLSVYAAYSYLASNVSYTKTDGTKLSVQDALSELYINNKVIRKYGSLNTSYDQTSTFYIKEIYENETDSIIIMTYYILNHYISGDYCYNFISVSTNNGNTWNDIYTIHSNTSYQGRYEIPAGGKVRIESQKNSCMEVYDIYFAPEN